MDGWIGFVVLFFSSSSLPVVACDVVVLFIPSLVSHCCFLYFPDLPPSLRIHRGADVPISSSIGHHHRFDFGGSSLWLVG